MDGYQFIASLVGALVWPTTVFAIASIQHKPLGRLIDRIKSAKLLGAEIGIGDEIAAVREKIESAPIHPPTQANMLPPPADPLALPKPEDSRVEQLTDELATTSATGTIVAAWLQLEEGLEAIAKINNLGWRPANITRNIQELKEGGVVSEPTVEAINSLRRIRNEVAHGRKAIPTLEEAASYRATVKEILEQVGFNASMQAWR